MANCNDTLICPNLSNLQPVTTGNMGAVFFDYPISSSIYANSIGLTAKRQTFTPKPIDGRFGYSVFNQKASQVGGSIQFFPLNNKILRDIWLTAQKRTPTGGIQDKFDIYVKYASNNVNTKQVGQFRYINNFISSINLQILPIQPIKISLDIIGQSRQPSPFSDSGVGACDTRNFRVNSLSPSASFNLVNQGGNSSGNQNIAQHITSLNIKLNNNIQRVYTTANRQSQVYYLSTGCRELSGSLTSIGSITQMFNIAQNTYFDCNQLSELTLQVYQCDNQSPLKFKFQGLVFDMQQMQLAPGSIFKTTFDFKSISGGKGLFGETARSYIVQ